ncbi:Anaphase-promoting complex subunit 2 [Trichuris trichiura]|uniref:Anaphase-promoting complex subunit 2 n=1 Tax=Trichuris trichiura TaxID=36087 RepID=A0A077YWS5_TRITR|nr:Anaphase-promoting complex subunit 2 [Trichuris trichiura]
MYQCNFCNRSFVDSVVWNEHVKRFHDIDKSGSCVLSGFESAAQNRIAQVKAKVEQLLDGPMKDQFHDLLSRVNPKKPLGIFTPVEYMYKKISPLLTKETFTREYIGALIVGKLLDPMPDKFLCCLNKVYLIALWHVDHDDYIGPEVHEDLMSCMNCGCSKDMYENESCTLLNDVHRINSLLTCLGLLKPILLPCSVSLAIKCIDEKINFLVSNLYTQGRSSAILLNWVEEGLTNWLITNFWSFDIAELPFESPFELAKRVTERFDANQKPDLRQYVLVNLGRCLMRDLFKLIDKFPESVNALLDLSMCVRRADLREDLSRCVLTMIDEFIRRSGMRFPPPTIARHRLPFAADVSTGYALIFYIRLLKSLHLVDPSDRLFEEVSPLLKAHLRRRQDMEKYLMDLLVELRWSDADNVLVRRKDLTRWDDPSIRSVFGNICSNCDVRRDVDYVRFTMERENSLCKDCRRLVESRRARTKPNMFEILVDIFADRGKFLKAFRKSFAVRMLLRTNFNTDLETDCLDRMRWSFSEEELIDCKVRLRDVRFSGGFDSHFHKQEDPRSLTHCVSGELVQQYPLWLNCFLQYMPWRCLVTSHDFWPPLDEEQFELPRRFKESLKRLVATFEKYRNRRTLEIYPAWGAVAMDLTLGETVCSVVVTSGLAAVIVQFTEKATWTATKLSESLSMSLNITRRRLSWWVKNGFLLKSGVDKYTLRSEAEPIEGKGKPIFCLDESSFAEEGASANDLEISEKTSPEFSRLEAYWSYVHGLIKTMRGMSAERILQLMEMMKKAHEERLNLTIVEQFLKLKVEAGILNSVTINVGEEEVPIEQIVGFLSSNAHLAHVAVEEVKKLRKALDVRCGELLEQFGQLHSQTDDDMHRYEQFTMVFDRVEISFEILDDYEEIQLNDFARVEGSVGILIPVISALKYLEQSYEEFHNRRDEELVVEANKVRFFINLLNDGNYSGQNYFMVEYLKN